jgi:hypothetical protein
VHAKRRTENKRARRIGANSALLHGNVLDMIEWRIGRAKFTDVDYDDWRDVVKVEYEAKDCVAAFASDDGSTCVTIVQLPNRRLVRPLANISAGLELD